MGIVYVSINVAGPQGHVEPCRFLVDSGATYSQLPQKIWKKIKLASQSRMDFAPADGTIISRSVSECAFVYRGISRHSLVILSDEGDPELLGAVTLETLGLVLNPFKRILQPMQLMLA